MENSDKDKHAEIDEDDDQMYIVVYDNRFGGTAVVYAKSSEAKKLIEEHGHSGIDIYKAEKVDYKINITFE